MKLGNNTINNAKLGNDQIQKVYLGTNMVWQYLAGSIATTHKTRVEADGGVIPSFTVLKETIQVLIDNYGFTSLSDFTTKIPVSIDGNVFGYKVGTGSGITLGQACNKLYSVNSSNDVVQATAANQPLLLVKGSDNYYFSPRVSGNQMQTINSQVTTYNNATDTLRVTAKIFLNSQTTTSFDYIFSCGAAGNFAISNRNGNKILRVRGSNNSADSSSYTPSSTAPHWVRYTMNTTQVIYEWSADGVSWTGIGTVTRPSLGSFSTTQTVCSTSATPNNATSVYSLTFENVTTAKTLNFTPNLYNRAYVESGWYELDGTTWSNVQSTGTTGLKGLIVDETVVFGDGLNYKLSNASLVTTQSYTAYVIRARLGIGPVYGLAASSQLSNDGTNTILNNGTALNISNTSKLKSLITAISDGASSSLQVNNGTPVTGNSGSNNGTYLDVLANASTYGNNVLTSLYLING